MSEHDIKNYTKPPWEYPIGIGSNKNVDHPSHYQLEHGVEVIDVTEQLPFNRGNAVKYIIRAGKKDKSKEVEDLEKAIWYIKREIKRVQR